MADNHRQEEIFELTEEMASDDTSAKDSQSLSSVPPRPSTPRISSVPPKPVSPFQPLVDPDAKPEEEPVTPAPKPDFRPSFIPTPTADPVRLSPIQRVIGKTTSMPPPTVTQPPPQPIRDSISKPPPETPISIEPNAAETQTVDKPPLETQALPKTPDPQLQDPVEKQPPPPPAAAVSQPPQPPPSTEKKPPRPPAAVSQPPQPPSAEKMQSLQPSQPPPVVEKAASALQRKTSVLPGSTPSNTPSSMNGAVATAASMGDAGDLVEVPVEDIEDLSTDDMSILTDGSSDDAVTDPLIMRDDIEVIPEPAEPPGADVASEPLKGGEDIDLDTVDSSGGSAEADAAGGPDAVFDTPEKEAADTATKPEEEDDDAEELDLSDAEEMPKAPPVPPISGAQGGEGRKPRLRRRQKRNKEWWARIFNDDYVSTMPKATVRGDQRKVNFIEKSLGVAANALVLDLACGNGRHSVGMAKRGYRMVGIDLSLPMLAQAAELAQEEHQNINFIHGDMRDLSFDKTFDSVFCMGTSFGYFNDEQNLQVLKGVFRALKPGGTFLLEVANRDHVITQTPDLTWFEGNGSVCMEESYFDFYTSRLHVTRQLIMDGGRQVQNDISIRLYTLSELCVLFQQQGFNVGQVSGHTATRGAFFGPDSVRIFMTAQRPL